MPCTRIPSQITMLAEKLFKVGGEVSHPIGPILLPEIISLLEGGLCQFAGLLLHLTYYHIFTPLEIGNIFQ